MDVNERIAIWGTGACCKQLMEGVNEYAAVLNLYFHINILDNIQCYIDADARKEGNVIYGKNIERPAFLVNSDVDVCIIAVRLGAIDIQERCREFGKRTIEWQDYLNFLKKIVEEKGDYIGERLLEEFPDMSEGEIIDVLRYKYQRKIEAYIYNYYIQRKEKEVRLSPQFEAEAIEWKYGEVIKHVDVKDMKNIHKESKRVGIILSRYYGGGIEKAISLLIPILLEMHYELFLFLDQDYIDTSREYDLDKCVKRIIVKNSINGNHYNRLHEIVEHVSKNAIDTVFYNVAYAREETFYEVYALKKCGIKTIIEVHSAVKTILDNCRDSESLLALYKLVDKVIVLSRYDKEYLEKKGCRAEYIPNMVDSPVMSKGKVHKFDGPMRIVWIGRLVQQPKRVLDTVEIMKKLVQKVSDVELQIVGSVDSEKVYYELIGKIKEYNLEDCIKICPYTKNIDEVYKNADIVLLTSESESFSNVIFESKAYAIPLVMYDLPWLELVADGKGCRKNAIGDFEGMANDLEEIINCKEIYCRLSCEAQESAMNFMKYDYKKAWRFIFDS